MRLMTRRMRQIHNALALVVGAQIAIWIISGLFFTLNPIEQVRGEQLRVSPKEMLEVPEAGFLPVHEFAGQALRVTLKPWNGHSVYVIEDAVGAHMIDAVTGAVLSPIDEGTARLTAERLWRGEGEIERIKLIASAPSESGRPGKAMWRVDYSGLDNATFWITPDTGEVRALRTGLWRTYDLMWGLHIMDWSGRETFTRWWIKVTAFGALVMTLAGAWLLVSRIRSSRLLKQD